MSNTSQSYCVATALLANLIAVGAVGTVTSSPSLAATAHTAPNRLQPTTKPHLDFSGRTRVGIASFYADWFAGKKMADGARMNPSSNNAASRTLPLGTVAKVTNLKTGKSVVVTIRDRGPYVDGRIVDLSPATARKIGITHRMGIARVRVDPLEIPLPNGDVMIARAWSNVSETLQ